MPETAESEQLKLLVLKRIGSGINPNRTMGPSNYCLGDTKIHARYAKPGWNNLIRVDYHGAKEVPKGTCHAILKDAGIKK